MIQQIKLIGELPTDLLHIGLKAGSIVAAQMPQNPAQQPATFTQKHNGYKFQCIVYSDNYEVITPNTPSHDTNEQPK